MKLHYATLRLGIAATEAQIKVAYRARARELHPDAAPEVDPRAFVELSEAYQTLTDPAARAEYDASLMAHCRKMRWVLCDRCGQPNRVPRIPAGKVATCGRCRLELPPLAAEQPARGRLRDKAIEVAVEIGGDLLDVAGDYLHQRLAKMRAGGRGV
jgi:hypothetical protein